MADSNGQDIMEQIKQAHENKWPHEKRVQYHAEHPNRFAGEGLAFPIADAEDVHHAAQLHGQAHDADKVKGKIIKIATEMQLDHALPDEWKPQQKHEDSQVKEAQIVLEPHITESLDAGQAGHDVRVTVIQGGTSINGYSYDNAALMQIARMIEGAQAYADHGRSAADEATRSVRDIVGFYHDAQFVPASGAQAPRVDATLHIFDAADWLWKIIQESVLLGRPNIIGLSIDIFGQWQQDATSKKVTNVKQLNSCDIVTRPSAGGSVQRILHDLPTGGNTSMGNETQQSQDTQTQQAPPTTPVSTTTTTTSAIQENQQTSVLEQHTRMMEQLQLLETQRGEVEALMNQAKLGNAQLMLERKLQESILPTAVKGQLKARFAGRIFEEAELDGQMIDALNMMAQLARDGIVRGNSYEKPDITSQITESEKVQAAFDVMFGLEVDTAKFGNIRPFNGIREAYGRVTGDASLFGGISANSTLGNIRVNESAPMTRITEADTTTATFSYLLGTSMNKRLLKDYQAWPAEWQKFCTIVPIRDFKQQTRVRLGAFASLSTVAEDSAYTTQTLTDSAATYVPTKRGNLVTVSRETIINDDLQSIKQIPTKLAVAAAYTLAEFVYAFFLNNPNIYDGSALFTSGAPHSNLGSTALSSAAIQTGVTAMREQTNFASKRLGLRPRFLIVPPELEFTAMVVTKSAGVPGSNNNDINPMLGYVTPIVSPQLTSTTQWFLSGDPREIDTLEIGFVGGQVNPALFIQDSPLLGLNFTQDAITYKIRHEYGGAVVDYRGLYRGI